MKKFIGAISLALGLVVTCWPATILAANIAHAQPIPDVTGVYDEPGHPNIKVKVSVHYAKGVNGGKPGGGSPTLKCSLDDTNSSSVVSSTGWKLPANVEYRLNPTSAPATVGSPNLVTIASNGFSDWQSAVNNKVAFTRGANTSVARQAYDGQNVIAWGRTSGSALAVTYTRYNTQTHSVVDVDTIFNQSFTWYWSSQQDCAYTGVYDAENILTHELGHWVGLDDTYDASYQNNTMYGYGSPGEVKKNTLTTGDIAGAQQIYGL